VHLSETDYEWQILNTTQTKEDMRVSSFEENYKNPEDYQNLTHIQIRRINLQKGIINFRSVTASRNLEKNN